MKKLLVITMVCFCFKAQAQLYIGADSNLSLADDALLSVDTDVINESWIDNNGHIILTGNWENRNKKGGLTDRDGTVTLAGNHQILGGIYPMKFTKLVISGQGQKAFEQDVIVKSILNLGDSQVSIGSNKLSLLSSDQNALIFNKGFVSMSHNGYLYRGIDGGKTYQFPLGMQQQDRVIYRPVEIRSEKDQDNIGASFIFQDPASFFFNRNNKTSEITTVNPNYFHVFDSQNGTSPVINIFSNSLEDKDYNGLALFSKDDYAWNTVNATTSSNSANVDLDRIFTFTAQQLKELPVALAAVNSVHDLTFYNSFTPDGDGMNDTWTIGGIDQYPDNEITIFNRWGGEVFRTKSISSNNSWDGSKLNGGTYYYLLKVKINNNYQFFKGFISLQKGQK
ncbi:gliding motility-associated C-terminal domain-containing protein [Pseudoxanthomonas sp. SGD-10]|nr:gliding motility-associated C-terminal domain-containing protein [Pseudoxanthomonas sp. SGD-10]